MTARKAQLVGLAVVALAVYALMWVGVVAKWHWLDVIDRSAIDALHAYGMARPGWVRFWDVLCTVLGPAAFRLFALALIVFALMRRNLRMAVFLVVSIELSGLLTEAAKAAANRSRPAEAMVHAASTSFPSGHALGVMVSVLALLTLALPVVRSALRVWLIAVGAVVVFTIGVGRVVLNVHHPSDVVAGWALGYVWFVACVLLVPPVIAMTAADETPEAPGNPR